MNKTTAYLLQKDLPQQAQKQIQLVYEIHSIIDNLDVKQKHNGKIDLTPKLIHQSTELRIKHEQLLDNKLELVRTNYATIKHLNLELPKLITPEKYQELKEPDKYINELLEDIKNQKKQLTDKHRKAPRIENPPTLSDYLAKIQIETRTLLETIQRAKKQWYKDINLEPHKTRTTKQKTIKNHVNWTIKHLEEAARTLNQYKANPIQKNKETIQTITKLIKQAYTTLASEIGNTKTLVKQHQQATHLNHVLTNEKPTLTKGIITPTPLTHETLVIKQALETQQTTKNTATLQTALAHLKQATASPYANKVNKIPLKQRPQVITRPTTEDKQLFWKNYLTHLLSTAGKAIKMQEEDKHPLIN